MTDPRAFTITPRSNGLTGEIADGLSGEVIRVGSDPVHVGATLAELYNRAALGIDALVGRVFWHGDIAVAAGGTNTVFSVVIGPIQAFTGVDNAGGNARRTRTTLAAVTLTLADVEGTPSNLSNSSVYYLYARDTGADLVRQISTTQPVGVSGGLCLFKSGDSRWVLLGAFVTDSSGAPIPYRARGGEVMIRKGVSGALAAMGVLTNGNATSNTSVSVAGFVPPYVRRVTLMVKVDNTTPAAGYAILGDGDDNTVAVGGVTVRTPDGSALYSVLDVTLEDSAQNFTYSVNHANTRATVWVLGWKG